MATKSLKLPTEHRDVMWSLTDRDYLFLDLVLILNKKHAELYRMVSNGVMSDAQLSRKASAITTSADGVEYLEARKKQLEEYYWGVEDDGGDGQPKKVLSIEESITEMLPDAVVNLRAILRDKNDENYGDVLRVFLTKLIKDMDTKNQANPPTRYLPQIPCGDASSSNICRYKAFCEKECEDECLICRYRQYGIEHGLNYDYKNQLDKTIEL
jgi:hypothetical protein